MFTSRNLEIWLSLQSLHWCPVVTGPPGSFWSQQCCLYIFGLINIKTWVVVSTPFYKRFCFLHVYLTHHGCCSTSKLDVIKAVLCSTFVDQLCKHKWTKPTAGVQWPWYWRRFCWPWWTGVSQFGNSGTSCRGRWSNPVCAAFLLVTMWMIVLNAEVCKQHAHINVLFVQVSQRQMDGNRYVLCWAVRVVDVREWVQHSGKTALCMFYI